MDLLRKLVDSDRALHTWLWASLICNMGIIVTGAVVRITGSGLGCPTWPQCTDDSYVPHGALGIHGAIEFGNRMLTYVLAVIAVGCFMAALGAADRTATRLSLWIALGIPAQAVIGGITVLTDLNPWVVGLHFMASMLIVMVCVGLLAVVVSLRGAVIASRTVRSAAPQAQGTVKPPVMVPLVLSFIQNEDSW